MKVPRAGDLVLGRYTIERPIGEGGMGVVFAAHDARSDAKVALKFLQPGAVAHPEAMARFVREARATAAIESDHVARVFDAARCDEYPPFMVLELLDGADLADLLLARGPLAVPDLADYLLQAIEALAHAHAMGIVHRDLKPSNLFLARCADGRERIKVLDFGISKIKRGALASRTTELTRSNAVLGTPLFMAPEQLLNAKEVDARCDIWALGVIGYLLLTGAPPFAADSAVALYLAIQESEPRSMRARRPELSSYPELESVIMTCLRRDPDERFASVTDLGVRLSPLATLVGEQALRSAKRVLPAGQLARLLEFDDVTEPRETTIRPFPMPPRPVGSWALGSAPTLPAAALRPEALDGREPKTPGPWSTGETAVYRPRGLLGRRAARLAAAAGAALILVTAGAAARSLIVGARPRDGGRPAVDARRLAAAVSYPRTAIPFVPVREDDSETGSATPSVSAEEAAPAATAAPSRRVNTDHGSTARTRTSSPSTVANRRCTPPYVVDAMGTKRWKLGCL